MISLKQMDKRKRYRGVKLKVRRSIIKKWKRDKLFKKCLRLLHSKYLTAKDRLFYNESRTKTEYTKEEFTLWSIDKLKTLIGKRIVESNK